MALQHPLVFLLLSAALILLSLPSAKRRLAGWFLVLSLAFVALQYQSAPVSLLIPIASLFLQYPVLKLMLRVKARPYRVALHWGWLLLTLGGFVIVKRYVWITDLFVARDLLPGTLETVGVSFLIFRQIHLAIDVRDGLTPSIRLLDYLNYTLAFWTFLAGPVQRFAPFCEQFKAITATGAVTPNREVLLGLNRALLGFFKMFIVGQALDKLGAAAFPTQAVLRAVSASIVFPLHLYINFSGYCDIMIGLARAVGFTLPENFRHPYLARNAQDFWTRWHITLSEFFRDYLYFPLLTSMSRRFPALPSMIVATLISFSVMGAWHGSDMRFAIFGFVHGLAVVTMLLYQQGLRAVLSKKQLDWYRRSRVINVGAVLCFQTFVILSFLPFRYDMSELLARGQLIIQLLGGPGE